MEDNSVNCTLVNGSSNDGSILDFSLKEDRGVLHLMGYKVFTNDDLIQKIKSCTSYNIENHEISKHPFDFDTLVQQSKVAPIPHYFVLHDFDRQEYVYKNLSERKVRIIGVTLLLQCCVRDLALSSFTSGKDYCSLFNFSLGRLCICFTNFASKTELNELSWMVKVMGGVLKRDYDTAIDNIVLIANSAGREKFESASQTGKICVKRKWLDDLFKMRHDVNILPQTLYIDDERDYFCPIFYRLKMFTIGFTNVLQKDAADLCDKLGHDMMEESSLKHATHILVNYVADPEELQSEIAGLLERHPKLPSSDIIIVDDRWFWECASTESHLNTKEYTVQLLPDGSASFASKSPNTSFVGQKRKHSTDSIILNSSLWSKRRSKSILDVEGAVICNTSVVPDLTESSTGHAEITTPEPRDLNSIAAKRDLIISEFISTEDTYVRHLRIIEKNYFEQIYNVVWDAEAGVRNHITISQNYRMFSRIPPIRIAHQALLNELLKFEVRRKESREKELQEQENMKNSPQPKGGKSRSQMMKLLESKSSMSPGKKSEEERREEKRGCDPGEKTLGRILLNWIGKDIPPPKDDEMKSKEMIDKGREKPDKKDGSWWNRERSKSKKSDDVENMDVSLGPAQDSEQTEKMEVDGPDWDRQRVCQLSGDIPPPSLDEDEVVLDEQGLVILSSKAIRQIFTYERNEYKDFHMSKQERSSRKRSGEQAEKDGSIDVLKIYKNYMTAMEEITRIIDECETSSFRFKALLKVEGSKRENERLSLRDLMIEPVQRLPRMILLLDAILRKTDSDHPDHTLLSHVQEEFKNVTSLLNDRKREVDEKYKLVSAFSTVADLPKAMKQSTRKLMGRYNAVTLGELSGPSTTVKPGNHVCVWWIIQDDEVKSVDNVSFPERQAFFEENDSLLEIVKLRVKTGSVSSAAQLEKSMKKLEKPYQHITHVNLRAITHVSSVLESDDKVGITYVDPPPRYSPLDQTCGSVTSEDKVKTREITIAFRLENEEGCNSLEMDAKRMEWQDALVTHVNRSRHTFNLPPIDRDFHIDPNMLHTQLFKDKSKRDIFNFAKRSVSRAFSQNKQSKPSSNSSLRKAQSQIVLNSGDDQGSFVFGKPPVSPSGSGSRFPKRTGRSMRDSH